MRIIIFPVSLFFCGALIVVTAVFSVQADETGPTKQSKIYDESADGNKQVADAIVIAKNGHKHILLQFGANSCVPCLRLHSLFETNQAIHEELSSNYVFVLIDETPGHNGGMVKKYGADQYGMPFLEVLDNDGRILKKEDVSRLNEGHKDGATGTITVTTIPEKVLDFLEEWKPNGTASMPLRFAPNPTVRFIRYISLSGGLKEACFEASNSTPSEIVCKLDVEQRTGGQTLIISIPPDGSSPFSIFVRPGDKPEIKAEVVRLVPVSRFAVPIPDMAMEPTATTP